MKKSTAEITMNGTGGDGVQVQIVDDDSRKIVCQFNLSGDELVSTLTGGTLSRHPITWFAADKIGWTTTNGIREVYFCDTFSKEHVYARAAIELLRMELQEENPGCEISLREQDAWNHHRRISNDKQSDNNMVTYNVVYWICSPPKEEK